MQNKFYRDIENEKKLGEFVMMEALFKEYYSLCLDESIDPTETPFSDFLTNANERWGGTLKEVNLDKLTPRYMTYRYRYQEVTRTNIICFLIPDVFSNFEVEVLLKQAFEIMPVHGAATEVLDKIASQLHGCWTVVDSHVGSFILE